MFHGNVRKAMGEGFIFNYNYEVVFDFLGRRPTFYFQANLGAEGVLPCVFLIPINNILNDHPLER